MSYTSNNRNYNGNGNSYCDNSGNTYSNCYERVDKTGKVRFTLSSDLNAQFKTRSTLKIDDYRFLDTATNDYDSN